LSVHNKNWVINTQVTVKISVSLKEMTVHANSRHRIVLLLLVHVVMSQYYFSSFTYPVIDGPEPERLHKQYNQ